MEADELTLDDVKLIPAPPSLNRELVKEWVDALRSGEYQQCTGALRSKIPGGQVGHCCLGVLASIAGERLEDRAYGLAGGIYPTQATHRALGFDDDQYDDSHTEVRFLSDAFGEKKRTYGFHAEDGSYGIDYLNDGEHWTFGQIADLIERDWL